MLAFFQDLRGGGNDHIGTVVTAHGVNCDYCRLRHNLSAVPVTARALPAKAGITLQTRRRSRQPCGRGSSRRVIRDDANAFHPRSARWTASCRKSNRVNDACHAWSVSFCSVVQPLSVSSPDSRISNESLNNSMPEFSDDENRDAVFGFVYFQRHAAIAIENDLGGAFVRRGSPESVSACLIHQILEAGERFVGVCRRGLVFTFPAQVTDAILLMQGDNRQRQQQFVLDHVDQ